MNAPWVLGEATQHEDELVTSTIQAASCRRACLHAEREGLLGQRGQLRGSHHVMGPPALLPIVRPQVPGQDTIWHYMRP